MNDPFKIGNTDHSEAGLYAMLKKSLPALSSACPLNISFYRQLLRVELRRQASGGREMRRERKGNKEWNYLEVDR